jgi:undecaprenyl-diphosphatase
MQTTASSGATPVAAPHEAFCCTHHHPPLTPAGFYRDRKVFLGFLAGLFLFLALSAVISSGWLLLTWDEPIQRFVESSRTPALDRFFLGVSRLGSTVIVIVLGTAAVALTWGRCRAVALAIAFSMLARPLLEFVLKEVVGRDRPDLIRLVNGTGYSFPSGHVMATIALWGLLPLVVGLFTRSRKAWWASVAVSATIILAVAASRVYLGVHWFSDVTAGIVLGSFFLLVVESVLIAAHRKTGCGRDGSAVPVPAGPPAGV